MSGPAAAAQATQEMLTGKKEDSPWKQSWDTEAAALGDKARDFSKSLTPDPRITGTGANIIQGFSKAVTEFSVGSVAGGPLGGAGLLAAGEGYARYQDLRDQGVDEQTAKASGLLEAVTAGGSALLPMGMPARWLKGLTTPGTYLAQAGAGAVINTSFGAASRYASAKILEDAGYHEMAEQQKPWDEMNLITDALAGVFFGAHAGYHGLKGVEAANVDPSIRDAAKVVQDRQEVNERAPGVPVDMKSAAVHRQALESALGDLMSDRPVDLSRVDTEGATFARPAIDEVPTTDIIREEFMKSGVLEDAAAFDRWLKGEPEPKPQEVTIAPPRHAPETPEEERAANTSYLPAETEMAANRLPRSEEAAHSVALIARAAEIDPDRVQSLATQHAGDAHEFVQAARQVIDEHAAAAQRGEGGARGTGAVGSAEPGRGAGTPAARPAVVTEPAGVRPGAAAAARAPGTEPGAAAADRAVVDRPDLRLPQEARAVDALREARTAEAQANTEAEPMHQAAIECEARHA